MSQTFSSSLLSICLQLKSAALSSGARQVVSNFTSVRLQVVSEWIGARLLREQQSKIKLQGVLRSMWSQRNSKNLHPSTKINLHTTTPKSPTNKRTNKHTNTQPTKQTNQLTKNRQTSKLKKTRGRNQSLLFLIMVTMPSFSLELTCH